MPSTSDKQIQTNEIVPWTSIFDGNQHSKKRIDKDIPWETIFDESSVKCDKCLNSIRSYVLRQNADIWDVEAQGKAAHLSFLKGAWWIKIAEEAKELANSPAWICIHPPDETYFVEAIQAGVKNLMEAS